MAACVGRKPQAVMLRFGCLRFAVMRNHIANRKPALGACTGWQWVSAVGPCTGSLHWVPAAMGRVGRGAGALGARGAKNERPGAGRGALQKKAGRYLEV